MKAMVLFVIAKILFHYSCSTVHHEEDDMLIRALGLMNKCKEKEKKDSLDIAVNIMGEWELHAYGCGFCVPHEAP